MAEAIVGVSVHYEVSEFIGQIAPVFIFSAQRYGHQIAAFGIEKDSLLSTAVKP
jgi:hypothetical protein